MKKKWPYTGWGIGAKAMAAYFQLVLLVVVLFCVLSFVLGYGYMRQSALNTLLSYARQIAEEESPSGSLVMPSQEKVELYQALTESMVFFVDTDYTAMHLSEGPEGDEKREKINAIRTEIINALDQQFIARILMGENLAEARRFEFLKGEAFLAGVPLKNADGRIVGGLILTQSIQHFIKMWSWMFRSIGIAGVAALLLSGSFSWMASRTLTRPLVMLTHAARRMGEGDYQARVEVHSQDEVGELGRAFNTLAARLNELIDRLRDERDQLGMIIGSIDEGIVAMDTTGRIVRHNQAFLELMELDGLQVPGASLGPLEQLMRQSMFSRKSARTSWKNPSGRNLLAFISPLFGQNREILGSVALLQDVSESERLEQLRRDYVANISHELRTPLTGIRGMVEPLMDGYIDTEEEKAECYRVIYKETLRLEKLIGDMLDVSRLQDGRVQMEMESLDVRGIVQAALRRVQTTAAEARVELKEALPEGELACRGDENRILQVLTIFLDNALSFTPEGGSVTVYVRPERDQLRLGVSDTGVGIEPKDLPFIWERFYKSDKSRMRTSGTGLGLAIAKLIVELMGGEIGVETQVGQGSDFYFTLKRT